MPANSQLSKKEKLKRIPHILAAAVILLHGFERFESGHGSHIFFFISGFIFLILAIFHHQLSVRFPYIDIVFFVIEAMLSLIIAYEYIEAGKKALPFVYIAAAMLQLMSIFIFSKKKTRGDNTHSV